MRAASARIGTGEARFSAPINPGIAKLALPPPRTRLLRYRSEVLMEHGAGRRAHESPLRAPAFPSRRR